MKDYELAVIKQARQSFIDKVKKFFPEIPFDDCHAIEKFIGVTRTAGQQPIALFIESHQPVAYKELVLS